MQVDVLAFEDFEFPLDRPVNYYLVKTSSSWILVDTGTSQGLSRSNAPRVDSAIITHYHLDHSGGLVALARRREKPRVCASEATARMLYDVRRVEERMLMISQAVGFQDDRLALQIGYVMRERYLSISEAAQALGLEPPERCLEPIGGHYIDCPGHSLDHICVEIGGRAFVGDNIVGGPNVTLMDVYRYFESMTKFMARSTFHTVHPGHGPHTLTRAEAADLVITTMRSKRKRLASVVASIASSEGWIGLDEVYRRVYRRRLDALTAWVAARSLVGYLVGLEADGVVEVDKSSSPWRVRIRMPED